MVYSFSRSQKSEFYSSLIMDSKGNLYGTASNSGHAGCYQNLGCGYVLEVTP